MELQEIQHARNLFRKNLQLKDLKALRSQIKGNNSIGREFQSLAVRGKELLT